MTALLFAGTPEPVKGLLTLQNARQSVNQTFNCSDRLIHHGLFSCIQFELQNLLYAVASQNSRNANIVPVHAELTVQQAAGR